jgi:hypothetical protein
MGRHDRQRCDPDRELSSRYRDGEAARAGRERKGRLGLQLVFKGATLGQMPSEWQWQPTERIRSRMTMRKGG